jgi:hypothetical protein
VVEKIMKYFNLMDGKVWNYDPYHVISNLRLSINFAPYLHHADPEMERWQIRRVGKKCKRFYKHIMFYQV